MNLRDAMARIFGKNNPKTQKHPGVPDFYGTTKKQKFAKLFDAEDELNAKSANPFDIQDEDLDPKAGEKLPGEEFVIFVPFFVSTNVLAIWWTPRTSDLFVAFDNHRERGGPRVYRYPGVPDHEFELFREASSKGKFVWGAYRWPGYPFDRLGQMPIPQDRTSGTFGPQKNINQEGDDYVSQHGNPPVN